VSSVSGDGMCVCVVRVVCIVRVVCVVRPAAAAVMFCYSTSLIYLQL
jgi:hypothetical protein